MPKARLQNNYPLRKQDVKLKKIPKNLSFSDHVALLGDDDLDHRGQRKAVRGELAKALECKGPCGPIKRSLSLNIDGQAWDWPYLCPIALLNKLCSLQPRLGDLIRSGTGPSLAIYMDEIKPGNVLRPDLSRTVACFYYTFTNLPSWYIARNAGWFFFAAFPAKLVDKLDGGYSCLMAKMLTVLFETEPLNFERGFPCTSSTGTFLCQAPFRLLLADEKALKELWGLRGAAGTKPCCLCMNVLGHMTPDQIHAANLGWLVHYSCPDRSQWAPHSSATFQDMRDRLHAVRGNKKQCNELGQAFGLQFSSSHVLWHPTIGPKVCPVQHTMYDWMHVLVAAGGVAQYELNEFAKLIKASGLPLSAIDTFGQVIVLPKARSKLPKKFWQDRVNTEENSHLKCFAAEVLVAVSILNLFAKEVLAPDGILPEHGRCLSLLADAIDILSQQDEALNLIDELQATVDQHAVCYKRLYPACCKPKGHYLMHLPNLLLKFEKNLSCFGPERKHRAVKTLAAHVFNDTLCDHVTLRMGHDVLQDFKGNQNLVEPFFCKALLAKSQTGLTCLVSAWGNMM